jgi:hypothetical protein
MTPATFAWWAIGACVVYAVAVDESVYPWLILQTKLMRIRLERLWYLVRYHPDSPWVRYEMRRNSERLAREIQSEINKRRNDNL